MGFNLAGGLAAAGGAIEQTAGNAALEQQKADLQNQSMILSDQLQTVRETGLEAQKEKGAEHLAQVTSDINVGAQKQIAQNAANLALAQAPKLAEVQRQISEANAADPNYLKSIRAIADASSTPEQRAQAAMAMAQTNQIKLQTQTEQEVEDARDALADAEKSGDENAITAAQRRMAVATYSAKDEVTAAAAMKGVADSARMYVESIDTRIARIAGSTQANTPEGKAQIDQLNGERAQAQRAYDTAQAMAVNAAKQVPDINLGRTPNAPQAGAPPLSSFYKPGGNLPVPGPTGIINTPGP